MNNEDVLYIKDFRKAYGDFVAVSGISFEVQRGEIFGLLGPNGAGKTTTLECLEGIRQADGGEMNILGANPAREPGKLRDLIGVQLQTSGLPAEMHADEAMRFFCAYHHVAPRYDLLDRMGLQEKRRTPYQQLSTGQQRRLALVLAIAHNPPVVILDEPTAGLDVASRTELHALMDTAQGQGRGDRHASRADSNRIGPYQDFRAYGRSLAEQERRYFSGCKPENDPRRLRSLFQSRSRPNGGCCAGIHQHQGR
jgi:ABC-2 type transport system ATP-binding protein